MQNIISFLIFTSILFSCTRNYTPKPKGFLRIELPAAQYAAFNETGLPYTFSVSRQATIELPPTDSATHWLNIDYPGLQAKIYCSYKQITHQTLHEYTDECIKLAERATRNADAITEKFYENKENKVYGTLFLIEGESASPIQFLLTDSMAHFFRGALYYKEKSNTDSIAPVTEYIKNDITELIQTFHWKK
ncbi:MAG: gliding motility protein GldD [Tannerella sp.]|jgi:gliding motility-associated lipoprotein GldD|nr:gliding motility protein GldD [Tannerella sp.]